MRTGDAGPDRAYPRHMTTRRLWSTLLPAIIFFGSIPWWDHGVEVVMLALLLAALAYEAVWWGHALVKD